MEQKEMIFNESRKDYSHLRDEIVNKQDHICNR